MKRSAALSRGWWECTGKVPVGRTLVVAGLLRTNGGWGWPVSPPAHMASLSEDPMMLSQQGQGIGKLRLPHPVSP